MAYLFKQKLQINELAGLSQPNFRVLVYEPEEYLGALYAHYLAAHNFDIRHCPDLAPTVSIVKWIFVRHYTCQRGDGEKHREKHHLARSYLSDRPRRSGRDQDRRQDA